MDDFCISWGAYNDSAVEITKKYYLAARTCKQGYNNLNTTNQYELNAMGYISTENIRTLNNHVDFALTHRLWLVEGLHGIASEDFASLSTLDFIKHLDYIKSKEKDIWIMTVLNAIKYLREKEAAKIICEDCYDNVSYKIRLEDDLNDSIYDQSLSISIKIPENWDSIYVKGAEFIELRHWKDNKFLLINALPNNTEILLELGIISKASERFNTKLISVSPNPIIDYIDLSFEITVPSDIRINLKNIDGTINLVYEMKCSNLII